MPRLPFDPDRVKKPAETGAGNGIGKGAGGGAGDEGDLLFVPPPLAKPAKRGAGGRRSQTNDTGTGSKPGSGARVYTVSEVASLVKDALAQHTPPTVRVVGEVGNLSDRTHLFFSLKDEQAVLRCVMFASSARRLEFRMQDGMQVVATGRLDFYDAQGHLQLYVTKIEPVGQGALELRLRALIEELRRAGYFDEARKKPLPLLPRRVVVVTSRTGAALQDVIDTAGRRWRGCQLLLLDVLVQGAAAAPRIAAALDALSRDGKRLGIEAIILTRGGGSMEDLWAFNERIVADAVYRCPLPIVAAIGHETDVTVAELVADRRCATPTQAAMALIPDATALGHQVRQVGQRLALLARRQVMHNRQRLETLARQPMFRRPAVMYQPWRDRLERSAETLTAVLPRIRTAAQERLDALAPRLPAALPRWLKSQNERVNGLGQRLEAIGPMNVLKRGYSYTLAADGRLLRSVAETSAGARITTVLIDGRLHSRVEDAGGPLAAPTVPSSRPTQPKRVARGRKGHATDEPELFG